MQISNMQIIVISTTKFAQSKKRVYFLLFFTVKSSEKNYRK